MKFAPLIFALLFLLTGCKSAKTVPDVAQVKPLTGIASAVARADVRVAQMGEMAKEHKKFQPQDFASFIEDAAKAARAELSAVNKQLNDAHDAAATAQDQLKEANYRIVQLQSEIAKTKAYWGYVWGKRIDAFLTWILVALGVAIVTRALSLVLVAHPLGRVFAFCSTLIFGVLTGGVSLLQTGFDNLWFRKVAPGAGQ
jgi:hypothetical protein